MPQRDLSIDFLRCIGMVLIVLAHSIGSDNTIFQIRAFDVPLMIFVSGLCFADKVIKSYKSFIWKRIKRLLIPTYLFLIVYFGIVFIARLFGTDFGITNKHIAGSFLLLHGIGFVWIIRVFLIVAVLTPLLLWMSNRIKYVFVFCLVLISIQTALVYYQVGFDYLFFRGFVLYGIGYSIVFLAATGIKRANGREKEKESIAWYAVLAVAIIYYHINNGWEHIIPINNYKYPPSSYYIIYGIAASAFLYSIRSKFSIFINKFTIFIGSHTLWIYLYHIPFFFNICTKLNLGWSIKFPILLLGGIVLAYLQEKLAIWLNKKYPCGFWKYLIG